MASPAFTPRIYTWHHTYQPTNQPYLISTDPRLVDRSWLNDAFDSKDMYWAKRLPLDEMESMLASSQSVGVYRLPLSSSSSAEAEAIPEPKSIEAPESPRTPSPTLEGLASSTVKNSVGASANIEEGLIQVGYARLITDYVTSSYLTDVYVDPAWRGLGLAKWLMKATRELMEDMPAARRSFLLASPGTGEGFYKRELGFWDVGEESGHAVLMTKRFFQLEGEH